MKVGRKGCEQFHERIKNDIDHQRNPPAKAVAEQTEDERAHGAHRQRDGNRVTEIGDARAEIVRHRHDHKRQQKKIERVQRPPEKTGEKRVALITVEEFKKPDRFHSVFQLFAWLLYRKLESQEAAIARESDSSVTRDRRHSPRQRLYNFASSLAPALLASTMSSNGR